MASPTLIQQVLWALENGEVTVAFRRLRGLRGMQDGDTVFVNPQFVSSFDHYSTLIHEVLHWLFPNASEEWILARECTLRARLKKHEERKLKRFLVEASRNGVQKGGA